MMSCDPCKEMEPQGASTKEACGREGKEGGQPGGACLARAGGQGPCGLQRALGEHPVTSLAETSACASVSPQGMEGLMRWSPGPSGTRVL